jgi:cholesterol transport system auxiliary component
MINKIAFRRMIIGLFAAFVPGCGALLNGDSLPAMYELEPPTEFPSELPRVPWSLVIGRPSAIGGLDSANIAVRPMPLRIDYYADGRWTTRAPDMLHNYIITSFQNTNLMKSVGSAAALDAGYLLETDLVRFETVYPPGSDRPEIHVRIYATLVTVPGGSVRASRAFEAKVTPASVALPDVIEAFDAAATQVVQELIRWTLTTPRRRGT